MPTCANRFKRICRHGMVVVPFINTMYYESKTVCAEIKWNARISRTFRDKEVASNWFVASEIIAKASYRFASEDKL